MKNGWQIKKIGDVCSLMTGGTPSKAKPEYFGGGTRWLVSGDIHQGEIFDCEGRITDAGMKNSNAKLLPINSVMIALNGQGKTRGTVALLRTEATCNQSLVSIYPNEPESLLPEFLYANLHGRYQELRQMTGDSGNDRRGLNMILIKNIEIPIAPVGEQRRIVSILDKTFKGIAFAQFNAKKNIQNARALFESHLQSVFPQGGNGWPIKKLGELSDQITDGTHNSPPYVESGIPMLDSKHVKDGFLINDSEPEKFISPATDALLARRCKPRTGDILISSRGSIGKIAIVQEGQDFNIMGNMILIRLPAGVNREFAAFYLHSQVSHIESIARGVAQKGLYLNQIRDYELPLPSEIKQARIGKQLDAIYAGSQHLESIYERKLTALEALKRSLLHQAFTGKL